MAPQMHSYLNYCISSKRRSSYYLFQLYRNAATIRGRLLFEVQTSRLLFISALPQCGDYRGRLLFEVQTSRLLFISALPQCGDYSRAATIRSTDVAATIYFSATTMRRLFEGGYYSKYRRRGYYLFQHYRNAATIRGRLIFEVRHLFEEIRYLPWIVIVLITLYNIYYVLFPRIIPSPVNFLSKARQQT